MSKIFLQKIRQKTCGWKSEQFHGSRFHESGDNECFFESDYRRIILKGTHNQ